ncbi:hypothetical protein LguiB_008917 [Lonicera macranthoides]
MDINTTALPTAPIKTPDAESEHPTRIQLPTKQTLPSTNGVLKRHQPHHRNSGCGPQAPVTYKECLKNHAASLGGHALDGCGEFMPSPSTNPTDPTSLKCAACGCHRNFHRRDPEDPQSAAIIEYQPHHRHHPLPPPPARHVNSHVSSPNSPSPPPISSSYYPSAPHMLLALSAGISGGPPDNNQVIGNPAGVTGIGHPNGRKRFRTKFTQQQKEKMHEFAERVGWKIQKRDEETIAEFCKEIGVDRGVLKVWMHNNKSTLGKKEANNTTTNGTTTQTNTSTTTTQYHIQINNTASNNNDIENRESLNLAHHQFHHNNDSNVSGPVVATNGSSSSS